MRVRVLQGAEREAALAAARRTVDVSKAWDIGAPPPAHPHNRVDYDLAPDGSRCVRHFRSTDGNGGVLCQVTIGATAADLRSFAQLDLAAAEKLDALAAKAAAAPTEPPDAPSGKA